MPSGLAGLGFITGYKKAPQRSSSVVTISPSLVCSSNYVHLNLPTVEESEAGWHTALGGWLRTGRASLPGDFSFKN
ncbi:hypothetical protein BDW72DRAFT_164208 [Aspergillus terricola var. indicus]